MRHLLITCVVLMTSAVLAGAETTPGVLAEYLASSNQSDSDSQLYGFEMCTQDECGCPTPNQFPGIIKQTTITTHTEEGTLETRECVCSCGVEPGMVCDHTAECGFGTRCTAPVDFQTHQDRSKGTCSDRCNYVDCPQFHGCYINPQDGEAMCVCKEYECSDSLVIPVKGERGQEIRIFDNKCEMVNENCRELKRDPFAAMWFSVPITGQ